MLAGISADYYLRLERGRDRNPSVQVLRALARVLQLDETHQAHLLSLACDVSPPAALRTTTAPEGVLALLQALPQPAFLENRWFDVVAANAAARLLSPRLVAGTNQLRSLFLDPDERALHADWSKVTGCLVANLRQAVGAGVGDPGVAELIGELRADPRFEELWDRHDVQGQTGGPLRLDHPRVGPLTLHRERLSVDGEPDLRLVVLHPEPGSRDEAVWAEIAHQQH